MDVSTDAVSTTHRSADALVHHGRTDALVDHGRTDALVRP
jgi:hypothetical protein